MNEAERIQSEIEYTQKGCSSPFNLSRFTFSNTVFVFELRGQKYVGRKTISEYYQNGEIDELHCSKIAAPMILGLLESIEEKKESITVSFKAISNEEKESIFRSFLKSKGEILFPYPRLTESGVEAHATGGWSFDPARAEQLYAGEAHLREYTLGFLAGFDLTDKRIFDPACSTGDFLYEIQQNFPECYTIGQDLSESMVEIARERVDEIHLGDALDSSVIDQSVDFLFLRFLNHEVVTRAKALELLKALLKKVKPEGHTILLGHTPILITSQDLLDHKLKVVSCLGVTPDEKNLFQYYVVTL